jgi:hypothetical protein
MLSGQKAGSGHDLTLAGAAAVALLAGVAVANGGLLALAGVMALTLAAIVAARPQVGAYLFLFANPLIVGIARGDLIPILRPNELLLILLLAAWAARIVLRLLAGRTVRPEFNSIDLAMFFLAVTSSVFPLLLRYNRGLPVTSDDFLYAIVLWKYLLLYWFYRGSVTTASQVTCCLWLSMTSAAVVAIVGLLQVANLFGIPELLSTYYDAPFTAFQGPVTERATSTLASPFSTADVMIMNLVVALACLRTRPNRGWLLIAAAGLFLAGCIAAASFSGFIGLAVALVTFGFITGRILQLSAVGIPAAAVAAVALWPVIAERLAGFSRPTGMPQSWEGRLNNLQNFFFPELFANFHWLTGVRPAARLPAPEAWREWVYIESGYVWLLWIGGVPLFLAFLFFVWVSWRHLRTAIRNHADSVGAAAMASLAYLMVIVVLMLLDPHLTIRGSADLFFPLLALASVRVPDADAMPAAPALGRRPGSKAWGGGAPRALGGTSDAEPPLPPPAQDRVGPSAPARHRGPGEAMAGRPLRPPRRVCRPRKPQA